MEYTKRSIEVHQEDKHLIIHIPKDLQKDFEKGAVAIRNRHVIEVMAVAVEPKVNSQEGRGASIFSEATNNQLKFSCRTLKLPQRDTRKFAFIANEKKHSLRNGMEFPIIILTIDQLFDMR